MINLASFVSGSNQKLFITDDALYIHLLNGNYSQDALLSRVFLLLRQVKPCKRFCIESWSCIQDVQKVSIVAWKVLTFEETSNALVSNISLLIVDLIDFQNSMTSTSLVSQHLFHPPLRAELTFAKRWGYE